MFFFCWPDIIINQLISPSIGYTFISLIYLTFVFFFTSKHMKAQRVLTFLPSYTIILVIFMISVPKSSIIFHLLFSILMVLYNVMVLNNKLRSVLKIGQ
jgi:hypothetical protein